MDNRSIKKWIVVFAPGLGIVIVGLAFALPSLIVGKRQNSIFILVTTLIIALAISFSRRKKMLEDNRFLADTEEMYTGSKREYNFFHG